MSNAAKSTKEQLQASLKGFVPCYSYEEFDRAQQIAFQLTDIDRANGVPTERFGYSLENFDLAEKWIREARRADG